MTVRAPIVGLILAAFVATTAVPGPQVVAHRHEGGERGHVHAHLHDDHHHDHSHAHEGADHDHNGALAASRARHADGLVAWDGEPGDHVHVVSPFQPATGIVPARIVHVAIVTSLDAAAPVAPPAPSLPSARSRGPPSAAHV